MEINSNNNNLLSIIQGFDENTKGFENQQEKNGSDLPLSLRVLNKINFPIPEPRETYNLPLSPRLRVHDKILNESRESKPASPIPLSLGFPRAPRFEGEAARKQIPLSSHVPEGNSKECPIRLTARPHPIRKANKRKTRSKVKSPSDNEVLVPRHNRVRGQARNVRKESNSSTSEQGKLGSATFLHLFMHMWNDFPEEKVKSFAYFDPLWFTLYANERTRAMVLNWVKEKGIFSNKYVLVPIVIWSHWSLLICCNLGESLESKTTPPCLLLLDSLRAIGPTRLEPLIRKLLLDLYAIDGRLDIENKQQIRHLKKISLKIPSVPQQRKGEECGYYVLYYIKLFLESAPENFNIYEGYPYFMKEDWFNAQGVESFYKTLDAIPIETAHEESDSSSDCFEIINPYSLVMRNETETVKKSHP